jgi:glycosyltransferase involved in cell wall biosynthesis
MPPIRVLDLRDTVEIGGPGKTILETHRAVDPARFALHLAVFARGDESTDTPFVRAAQAQGLPVHVLRAPSQFDPRLALSLARLVREERFDIVHSHETKSDAINWLATWRGRYISMTTLHGWIGNSRKQRAMIWLDRRLVRRFDRVLVVSDKVRSQLLASGMPAAKVTLVHNAIVLERYQRTGRPNLLDGLVGRHVEPPIAVTIGRLSAEKGHRDFVAALGLVAARGGKLSAVLVGDGPERPRLEAQVAALGLTDRVHFTGYIQAPERVFEDVDLMVLPSYTEGLPNVVLESLVMDVPVLATRVGGTPEVITDGVSGRLVAPGQPEALAAEMLAFLGDRPGWQAMARAGRAHVVAHFDFRARTRRLEQIYTELVAGRPA